MIMPLPEINIGDLINDIENAIDEINLAFDIYDTLSPEVELQLRRERQLFIKIEIIDTNNNIIAEISGSAIGGNYNLDGSSPIRRTCSISFNLENDFVPSSTDSVFWVNKKFHLFVGLYNSDTNEPYWFDKGVYAIKDPTINITINANTISINGLDKMALYNGDISGQIPYGTIVEVDSNAYVHDAVRAIMQDGGETNLIISDTNLQIPYKIESAIGDTRWDMVSKLVDLFYNYQAYYNINGDFVFCKKPVHQSSDDITNTISMYFVEGYDEFTKTNPYSTIISINREIAYSNIKNKVVVYGGVHDDGYQPKYEIVVDNEHYPNSPYTVEKLNERHTDGSVAYRTLVIQDDSYVDSGVAENVGDNMADVHSYSISLCQQRAEQEVYLHQQATEKITLICVPLYSLDINDVIYIKDSKSGIDGEYVINNISCGLSAKDTMSITANKLW